MIAKQIKAIEKDVSKMLDKIIGSSNTTVIAAFEKLIEELESHQVGLIEKKLINRASQRRASLKLSNHL